MHKASLKQVILKSIEKLPQDASLEDIILNIYLVHNEGKSDQQNIGTHDDIQGLLKDIREN